MKLLLIDNYDSFTFNLYQLVAGCGVDVDVRYNDEVSEVDLTETDALLLSPGPGTPDDAGCTLDVIAKYHERLPIFGVCLGHQSIVQSFGGKITRAEKLMHGKTSRVYHDGKGLYAGLTNPLEAGRYHSLIANEGSLPECLEIASYTSDGEIMGVRHKQLPIFGVQFHPESILTDCGQQLVQNFLTTVRKGVGNAA
ncbi:MAG: anthranilate synthase component II [Planctomycetota bacterium]|jgi:anthranilate synthase/aminodeoxychorismate synthase-like glutamine amidotransferase